MEGDWHRDARCCEWVDARTLELKLPVARLRLSFLEKGIVRCRYVTGAVFEAIPSYGVATFFQPTTNLELEEEAAVEGFLTIVRTPILEVRVRSADGGVEFYRMPNAPGEGKTLLCADAEGMGHRLQERTGDDLVWVLKHMPEKAHFFGLGDKPCGLNMRGKRFEMWGSDHYKFSPSSDPLYKSIPFFLCLNSGEQYGIFFDNTMRSYFDFGKERKDRLLFGADGGVMDYYFIHGEDALDTVRSYTRLTGTAPMPPLWALGYHQSKWSYYPENEVRVLAEDLRTHRIPCDAIHLDIHHMKKYQSFTWDRERFPDPPALIHMLEEKGLRVVTIVDPGIRINPDNYVWRSGFEKNVFCRRHDGALLQAEVWPGSCNFPDYTSPTTRDWWADLFDREVGEYGVRGIWIDMNEPAVFPDRSFPDDTRHAYDGYACSHLKAHNIYGQCMAEATREGMRRSAPERRPFVLSRSGFAGLQRHAATWTGDNFSDWENLKMANLMVQRLSSSGISFCGADTGGFLGRPTPELFVRWMQMAAFHVFFRNHNNGEFGGQEPWCFGEEAENYVRIAIEQRYRLLPYIYTQFYLYATEGTPIVRSLALMYSGNPDTYWRSSEFFFGADLYVIPVHHAGQTERSLYLPPGSWFSLWDDSPAPAADAEAVVPTPMDHIPVFVRGGCIIPRWPVQQFVGQQADPPCSLELWWSPNTRAESLLYEDAGDGSAPEHGAFCLHHFICKSGSGDLRITHEEKGDFLSPRSAFDLVLHALPINARVELIVDGTPVLFTSEGSVRRADLPAHFHEAYLLFHISES